MKTIFVVIILMSSYVCYSNERVINDWDVVYAKVSDIQSPKDADFLLIQDYLLNGRRDYLKWLNYEWYIPSKADGLRYDFRARNLKLGNNGEIDLELHKILFNDDPNYRDCCVVCYGSWNSSYTEKISRIKKYLKKCHFTGHFLYRLGGWPDVEGGSLTLIHVPYSFKLCMIREAYRLGYKNIIWIDSAVIPGEKFNAILRYLEEDGYFLIDHVTKVAAHDSPMVVEAFSLTEYERASIPQIQASLIGLNMENERTRLFFENSFEKMRKLKGFLSPRPEQVALGIVAHRLKMFPQLPYSEVFTEEGNVETMNHFYKLAR